jgi:outer membrane protein OmpA-like peptidoglycan-associated protein
LGRILRRTSFRRARTGLKIAAAIGLAACQTTGQPHLTKRQVAALKSEGFERTTRGWEFGAQDRLLFPIDESRLTPEKRQDVARIALALVAVGIAHAALEGHADDTGSANHNLALSRERAEAVAKEMAASGFPAAGLTVVGLDEKYPVDSNRTSAGRRENRRVVVLVGAK